MLKWGFVAGSRAKDAITPYSDAAFATETESVKLSCNYTGSVESLHWYRQYPGSPPQFLILDYYGTKTQADPPVSGISISHRKEASSVDLEISSAKV
ncbi:hypothetical protein F2P79_019569 [Pimephales promelas]|nr:hypothetical protein F2P79_019569 [Pimephales promelas]